MSTQSQLPKPGLVRTTHAPDGTSIFASDEEQTPFQPFGPTGSSFVTFHSTASIPTNLSKLDAVPAANTLPRCPPRGSLFCVADFAPSHHAPMHRTLSLDYACVLDGEIVLRLDGGEERVLKSGEFLVQGGVNHEWINRTDRVARVVFVLVASEKIVLEDGTALE